MNYDKFIKILNDKIFEESKSKLIEKISKNPDRYIGLFRPTGAKAKLNPTKATAQFVHVPVVFCFFCNFVTTNQNPEPNYV